MAIYHFSAKVISRSQGRSSVAASAYRAAEQLVDNRTGEIHDFTQKNDVVDKLILLPEGAPEWLGERETLWNTVEEAERRKDAQLSREINVALPLELTEAENWTLLTEFVQTEFVDKGMVADVAFHRGHGQGGDQPHGHIMLSLREVTPEGFGQKVRAWNDKTLLAHWRERWATHCNLELARHGFDQTIDHRTLEAQGIELEPQSKIGAKAAQLKMARFVEHQALARRNGERLLGNPTIALAALTRQHSTFTPHDVARFASRHSVDAEQFDAVSHAIHGHEDLVTLGVDAYGRTRLTSRTMLRLETEMMTRVIERALYTQHCVSDVALQQGRAGRRLSAEQSDALRHITQHADVACVVGYAGTGKSYLLGAARDAWTANGYQVMGAALSGIAAENLQSGAGIESRTVASYCWHWARGQKHLDKTSVLVVDEAGMLSSRQMAAVVEEVTSAQAKLVLVGDPAQLQAIEAGAAFRAITEHIGFAEITTIHRQVEEWQQSATRDFAKTRTAEGLDAYQAHDAIHTFNTTDAALQAMVDAWDRARTATPDASQLMLAYTRDAVSQLNHEARARRMLAGELGQSTLLQTSRGVDEFADGDCVMFLRNESERLGVKNGSVGTIESIDDNTLTVRLAAKRCITFNTSDYNDIDHGYAATIHKAQGVTVDRVHVLASRYLDRHSTYVAMSRHRTDASLYVSREDFPDFNDMARVLGREAAKDTTLDYCERPREAEARHVIDKPLSAHDKPSDRFERRSLPGRADLTAFKAKFEAKQPEKAAKLAYDTLPTAEKEALAAMREHQRLEKAVSVSHGRDKTVNQYRLDKHTEDIAENKPMHPHLEKHAPKLAKQLVDNQTLSKSHKKDFGPSM